MVLPTSERNVHTAMLSWHRTPLVSFETAMVTPLSGPSVVIPLAKVMTVADRLVIGPCVPLFDVDPPTVTVLPTTNPSVMKDPVARVIVCPPLAKVIDGEPVIDTDGLPIELPTMDP